MFTGGTGFWPWTYSPKKPYARIASQLIPQSQHLRKNKGHRRSRHLHLLLCIALRNRKLPARDLPATPPCSETEVRCAQTKKRAMVYLSCPKDLDLRGSPFGALYTNGPKRENRKVSRSIRFGVWASAYRSRFAKRQRLLLTGLAAEKLSELPWRGRNPIRTTWDRWNRINPYDTPPANYKMDFVHPHCGWTKSCTS